MTLYRRYFSVWKGRRRTVGTAGHPWTCTKVSRHGKLFVPVCIICWRDRGCGCKKRDGCRVKGFPGYHVLPAAIRRSHFQGFLSGSMSGSMRRWFVDSSTSTNLTRVMLRRCERKTSAPSARLRVWSSGGHGGFLNGVNSCGILSAGFVITLGTLALPDLHLSRLLHCALAMLKLVL